MVQYESSTRVKVGVAHLFLVVLTSMFILGCGSTQELPSSWSNDPVTIDGSSSDWTSGLMNLKDTKVFLGVRNDENYVYLCLTSSEPSFRRQLVGAGLSVWFETDEGKRIGVQYPIGMLKQGMRPTFNPEEGNESDDRERMLQQGLQDLEILGPGEKDRNLLSVVQVPGISTKVGILQGSTVYELKMPLAKSSDHPYAVGASPGSTVNVTIATGSFDGEMRPPEGGHERMGGGGGMGRGRGGMPGGGMGGGGDRSGGQMPRGNRPEPLNVSLKVHLAVQNPGQGQ